MTTRSLRAGFGDRRILGARTASLVQDGTVALDANGTRRLWVPKTGTVALMWIVPRGIERRSRAPVSWFGRVR